MNLLMLDSRLHTCCNLSFIPELAIQLIACALRDDFINHGKLGVLYLFLT
jgi:hypothetical protein